MIFFTTEMVESVKNVGDWASAMLVLATLADILPAVAALLSIIWMLIRIYETCTVQRWLYGKTKDCDPNA